MWSVGFVAATSDLWGAPVHRELPSELRHVQFGIEAVREENAWLRDQALEAAREVHQLGASWLSCNLRAQDGHHACPFWGRDVGPSRWDQEALVLVKVVETLLGHFAKRCGRPPHSSNRSDVRKKVPQMVPGTESRWDIESEAD